MWKNHGEREQSKNTTENAGSTLSSKCTTMQLVTMDTEHFLLFSEAWSQELFESRLLLIAQISPPQDQIKLALFWHTLTHHRRFPSGRCRFQSLYVQFLQCHFNRKFIYQAIKG
jgi:hypothetical protein